MLRRDEGKTKLGAEGFFFFTAHCPLPTAHCQLFSLSLSTQRVVTVKAQEPSPQGDVVFIVQLPVLRRQTCSKSIQDLPVPTANYFDFTQQHFLSQHDLLDFCEIQGKSVN